MVDAARVRQVLNYDENTGILTWKMAVSRRVKVGAVAGNLNRKGYSSFVLDGRRHLCHRIVWLIVYGSSPPDQIDHINGICTDNRVSNLRLATNIENQWNKKTRSTSKGGFKGVYWHARDKRWYAVITANKKKHYLGLFKTPELAHEAYVNAAPRFHGDFARSK